MVRDKKLKIGVLLYTYNRVDDARINMEIIRDTWKKSALLANVVIVHAFNGEHSWWSEKYLEDELLQLENPGHFAGAEILLNEGIKTFESKYSDVDYVIILASDTWCVMPEYIEKIILAMQDEEKYLAVCAWGNKNETDMFKKGMSLDFDIINRKWATENGLFPIGYTEFCDKYHEIFWYQDKTVYPERVFALRFKQAISKSVYIPSENLTKKIAYEHIYHMKDREPVHEDKGKLFGEKKGIRKMYWPKIGLITHHEPIPKQKALKQWSLSLGTYGNRFLSANDLAYYNSGFTKTTFAKGKKKLGYND